MHRFVRLAAVAVVTAGMVLPGLSQASALPGTPGDDECRMFETKPGYTCSFGEWRVDMSPPRAGKACSIGEPTRGRDLQCVAGRWQEDMTPPRSGDSCTSAGAMKIGAGGMLQCSHGARGFTWE